MLLSLTRTRAAWLALGASLGLASAALSMPQMFQDAPKDEAPAKADDAKPGVSADLPKAKKVIEDAIDAMGGRDAFKSVKSMMFKISITSPAGAAAMEGFTAQGGKFLLKQEMGGMMMRTGSNGKIGWMHHPMAGYDLMDDEDLPDMQRQAEMHSILLRLDEEFETMETVGRADFAGKPCYKVRMVPKNDKPKAEDDDEDATEPEQFYFFDVESKLLSGVEATQETPFGSMTSTMRFDEWKKKGDLNLFTRVRFSQMGMEAALNFTELELDVVDDAIFELPAEVKKLAEDRKNAEKPGETPPGSPESRN